MPDLPEKAVEAAGDFRYSGCAGHRIVLEFDGDASYLTLIHPENGCEPAEEPASEDETCWLTDWAENEGTDLLHGKVELPVRAEWHGDHARLYVEQPAGLLRKLAALAKAQELLKGEDARP